MKKTNYTNPWIYVIASVGISFIGIAHSLTTLNKELEVTTEVARRPFLVSTASPTKIEFDFGNGKKRIFEGALANTVYSLDSVLRSIAETAHLKIIIGQNGKLDTVSGQTGKHTWHIYRNGKIQRVPIHTLTVGMRDYYLFRYE